MVQRMKTTKELCKWASGEVGHSPRRPALTAALTQTNLCGPTLWLDRAARAATHSLLRSFPLH
jgi:hypothetical protein